MTKMRRMTRAVEGGRRAPEYIVTLQPDGFTLRPKRARRPEATVAVTWDWVYERALFHRDPPKRRRKPKRGKL